MADPLPARPGPAEAAFQLARKLSVPGQDDDSQAAQCLVRGAAGIALLHIERARTGEGTWRQAHAWVRHATAGEVSAADSSALYRGAPAIAFMLRAAGGSPQAYRQALSTLDTHVIRVAHRRADSALTRIGQRRHPAFAEYDIFSGLTGIGAYLLQADPGSSAMERILSYLTALTVPVHDNGQQLPGWWAGHGPQRRTSARFPGGHANLGAAHGVTGPLLLLAQAARRGITVSGHHDAISRISLWLDTWRQESDAGPWWPQWISRADLDAGRPAQREAARPSWCYGTPGIARAQQLAAIATGDARRRNDAEDALRRCLDDPRQMSLLTGAGLCHGYAGVYQATWRAARDAAEPDLAARLPDLAASLSSAAHSGTTDGTGFLDGDAGAALALSTAARGAPPISGWDTCLLIG